MTTAALPRRALGTVAQQAVIMFDYLVESAANCRVVTYGTTEEATRIPATFQGRVHEYLYDNALMPLRLPPLTALVVNSGQGDLEVAANGPARGYRADQLTPIRSGAWPWRW